MSAFSDVIAEVPEEDWAAVTSAAILLMNTSPGWRPSAAAREAVRRYRSLGADGIARENRERNRAALEACAATGCAACRDSLARLEASP